MKKIGIKGFATLLFFIVFFISLHYMGFLGLIESGVRKTIDPISTRINLWQIKTKDDLSYYTNKDELINNYNKCLKDRASLESTTAFDEILKRENEELKRQLNFVTNRKFKFITSDVIGHNLDGVDKMIIINAGELNGVRLGQPVVVGDGILVAVIAKVNKDSSMARLINDNKSKIAGKILNRSGSLGIVEGGYGLSVKMNFIPRNEDVLVGDQVVTSGMEDQIPKGLLIGEVAVAENEAYQPFQQAILSTATDLSKLSIVSILQLEKYETTN